MIYRWDNVYITAWQLETLRIERIAMVTIAVQLEVLENLYPQKLSVLRNLTFWMASALRNPKRNVCQSCQHHYLGHNRHWRLVIKGIQLYSK